MVAFLPRPAVDAIAYVPGDRDRELRRGHSPAASLARELAGVWEIPVATLLRRRRGVDRQRDLPLAERRQNAARAFATHGQAPRRVCLVDDVYTTGSTATACATAYPAGGRPPGRGRVLCPSGALVALEARLHLKSIRPRNGAAFSKHEWGLLQAPFRVSRRSKPHE
jgi:hypothetical protein